MRVIIIIYGELCGYLFMVIHQGSPRIDVFPIYRLLRSPMTLALEYLVRWAGVSISIYWHSLEKGGMVDFCSAAEENIV